MAGRKNNIVSQAAANQKPKQENLAVNRSKSRQKDERATSKSNLKT